MNFLKFKTVTNDTEKLILDLKPITMTPALLQRQYEEECIKKYNLTKKHTSTTI